MEQLYIFWPRWHRYAQVIGKIIHDAIVGVNGDSDGAEIDAGVPINVQNYMKSKSKSLNRNFTFVYKI